MSAPVSALLRTIAVTNLVPTLGLLPLRQDAMRISDLLAVEPYTSVVNEARRFSRVRVGDCIPGDFLNGHTDPTSRRPRTGIQVVALSAAAENLALMLGIGWLIVGLIAVLAASQH